MPPIAQRSRNWQRWNQLAFWASFLILACFGLGSILGWLIGYTWPDFMRNWVWPCLLSAVVGYLTNYIAVQMLFLPYSPQDKHWLTLITLGWWRQGVVPQRKHDLAGAAAQRVSQDLLPPEVVADELNRVVSTLLDNPEFRSNVRLLLGPVIRTNLPSLVDRITPEVMSLMRLAVSRGLSKENLIHFVDEILGPWLATQEARDRFVSTLLSSLRSKLELLVRYLQNATERYAEKGWLKWLTIRLGTLVGAIDWDAVRLSLYEELGSHTSRQRLYELVSELVEQLRNLLRDLSFEPVLSQLSSNASDYIGGAVESFLSEQLPEVANRLLDAPGFWRWLIDEALPNAKSHIVSWLDKYGQSIAEHIDLRGRAQRALEQMDVAYMHRMANNVAGQELGAIQVLGFIIGLVVGLGYSFMLAVF